MAGIGVVKIYYHFDQAQAKFSGIKVMVLFSITGNSRDMMDALNCIFHNVIFYRSF
jgi:hypothetical protein